MDKKICRDKVFQEIFSKETTVILISLSFKCKKNALVFQISKTQNTIFLYKRSKNVYLYEAIYKYIPAKVHPEYLLHAIQNPQITGGEALQSSTGPEML